MSSILGRKIKLVRCHTTVHTGGLGLGQVGPAIDENAKQKGTLSLTSVEGGVLLTHNKNELFISNGNIISYELYPVEVAPVQETTTLASKLFKK